MIDGALRKLRKSGATRLSSCAASWMMEGVTEVPVHRRKPFKNGRSDLDRSEDSGLDILAWRAYIAFKWKHLLGFWYRLET